MDNINFQYCIKRSAQPDQLKQKQNIFMLNHFLKLIEGVPKNIFET